MKADVWKKACAASADPVRAKERIKHLREAGGAAADFLNGASPEVARILCAVLSGSTFLNDQLVAQPEWLSLLEVEALRHPRRWQGMRREVESCVARQAASRCDRSWGARLVWRKVWPHPGEGSSALPAPCRMRPPPRSARRTLGESGHNGFRNWLGMRCLATVAPSWH